MSELVQRKGVLGEARDPQTVFFLNPIVASGGESAAAKEVKEALQKTAYSWAVKIENTVQEKLGKGQTAQACWDRASFRAKLVDYLCKQTPW